MLPTSGLRLNPRLQRDYSPASWTQYFDEAYDIDAEKFQYPDDDQPKCLSRNGDTFRVYLKNFKPPYAPTRKTSNQTTDSVMIKSVDDECDPIADRKILSIPTLILLHGGGYSALTWAEFTRYIVQNCQCRVMAIDLRGHGDTKTSEPHKMDMDTLVSDVFTVAHATHKTCGFSETPKLVLVGHSMGGALAVKCAFRCAESLPTLAGFVVIDVVEGTAKEALPVMSSVISTRPKTFPSLTNAIEWCVRSGMAKNADAASVSMPGSLLNIKDGHLAIHDVPVPKDKQHLIKDLRRNKFSVTVDELIGERNSNRELTTMRPGLPLSPRVQSIKAKDLAEFGMPKLPPTPSKPQSSECKSGSFDEKDEDDQVESDDQKASTSPTSSSSPSPSAYKEPPRVDESGYGWRTKLAKTQPFWNGWFENLSNELLESPVLGKLLLLAGIDRLDRSLTIAHMQGKFTMKVLPKCGHAVHEDLPEQVASTVADFLIRNQFTWPIEDLVN